MKMIRSKSRRTGFTLLEMMMSVTIFAYARVTAPRTRALRELNGFNSLAWGIR